MNDRAKLMVDAYLDGCTLEDIGKEHGVSRERVRQILKKHGLTGKDGGVRVKSARNAAKRKERIDARYMASWGCSREYWETLRAMHEDYWQTPVGKYYNQMRNAMNRGIEWAITLKEWWETWESSGVYEQRGINKGQYVMARFNDVGPYAVGNVYITTTEENLKEYRTREYPAASVADSWLSRRPLTPEAIYEQLHDE